MFEIMLETFVEIKKELFIQNIEKIEKMSNIPHLSSFIKPSSIYVYQDEEQPKTNIEEIPEEKI